MSVFNLFQHQKYIISDALLMGMTDIHSHILPNVDDGAKDIKEAVSSLLFFKKIGLKKIFLTPHIKGDFPKNNTSYLQKCLDNFTVEKQVDIEIRLAAEYMLDEFFYQHLNAKDLLTFDGKHILVEISYFSAPINLYQIIYDILLNGYIPIIAHPERYTFMSNEEYNHLKAMGCKFQLNLFSLSGYYGRTVKNTSLYLLSENLYDFVGSDTHGKRDIHAYHDFHINKKLAKQLAFLLKNNDSLFIN